MQSFKDSSESDSKSVETSSSNNSSSQSAPKTKDWQLKHVDKKEALDNESGDSESSSSADEIDKIDNNTTLALMSRSRKSCLTNIKSSSKAKQAAQAMMMTIGCFTAQGYNTNSSQRYDIAAILSEHAKAIDDSLTVNKTPLQHVGQVRVCHGIAGVNRKVATKSP